MGCLYSLNLRSTAIFLLISLSENEYVFLRALNAFVGWFVVRFIW